MNKLIALASKLDKAKVVYEWIRHHPDYNREFLLIKRKKVNLNVSTTYGILELHKGDVPASGALIATFTKAEDCADFIAIK